VKKSLSSILKSSVVHGIMVSATSAGVFVLGANVGLSVLGFTTAGIQAGSIAAAWMSSLGSVSGGSLFAMLQSAGVVGFGVAATGGLVIVGGAVGGIGFGVYKLVTRDRHVKVYKKRETIQNNPQDIKYYHNTKLKDLLVKFIVADIFIPADVTELGIQLYDSESKSKSAIQKKDLEKDAKDVIKNQLVIFRKIPGMTNDELPFYLKRCQDLWRVENNTEEKPW